MKTLNINRLKLPGCMVRLHYIDDPRHEGLIESIRQYGVLQPLLVRIVGDDYEIIKGCGRYAAAKFLELKKVPCTIMDLGDQDAEALRLSLAFTTTHVRPVEMQQSLLRLLCILPYAGMEDITKRLHVDDATVMRLLRLEKLTIPLQQIVLRGTFPLSRAHMLTGLPLKEQSQMLKIHGGKGTTDFFLEVSRRKKELREAKRRERAKV